jgi:hypothetical protein
MGIDMDNLHWCLQIIGLLGSKISPFSVPSGEDKCELV